MTDPGARSILVVDHRDSFVHTLIGYLSELGATVEVREADEISSSEIGQIVSSRYAGILLSPGPGSPDAVPASLELVRGAVTTRMPLLGVCLGHQVIAQALGARVIRAPELLHGVTSPVSHDASLLFAGVPSPFTANRYHSLAIDPETVPTELEVTARADTGVIMGIAHRSAPVWGVQFHPESVLTEGGYRLLANWLGAAGIAGATERAATLHPHRGVLTH